MTIYTRIWTRDYCFHYNELCINCFTRHIGNFNIPDFIYVIRNGLSEAYIPKDTKVKLRESLIQAFAKNTSELKQISKKLDEAGKNYFETAEKISKLRLQDLSNAELAELIKDYYSKQIEFSKYIFFIWNIGELHGERTIKLVAEKAMKSDKSGKIWEYMEFINSPTKKSSILLLEDELSNGNADAKSLFEKYRWIPFGDLHAKEWSFEDFEDYINSQNKDKKKMIDSSELIKDLQLSEEEYERVLMNKEMAYLRDHRDDIRRRTVYQIHFLFKEIARRLNIPYDTLMLYSTPETVELLHGKPLSKDELERRKGDGVMIFKGDRMKFLTGAEAEHYTNQVKEELSSEIKGLSAYRGKARGKAKIVKLDSDIKKIEEGDIMVAVTTHPDYVLKMKMAKAIVTDEGGLTCHAAIVSRELGTPCIVGTRNATKVLKDGDYVEVDAEKGVVRKIIEYKKVSTGDYKVALIMHMFLEAFAHEQEKVLGYGHKNAVIVFNDLRTRFYVDSNELKGVGQYAIEKLNKDPLFGEKVILEHKKVGEELLKNCEEIYNTNLSEKSNGQLNEIFQKYYNSFVRFSAFHLMPVSLEKEISKKVMNNLKPLVEDVNDTIITVSTPTDETNLVREKKGLLKIAILMKDLNLDINSKQIMQLLEGHTRKFEWMGVTHKYTPHTIEYYTEKLQQILEKDPKKELHELADRLIETEKQRDQILKNLDINDEIRSLIDILQKFSFMRDFKRDTGYKSHYFMEKLWNEIAKRADLTAEQVKNLVPSEINNYLLDNKLPNKEELDKRLKYQIISIVNGELKHFTGEKAEEFEKVNIVEEEINQTDSFKGMPANKGKVKGRVKIVLKPEDISKVEKGDILVAVNTEPAMVPAMERASAIITDEGGVTCHAAIVSRELGKPCIIGTKVATKILKDGDYVEVDAEKGIVTKVKEIGNTQDILKIFKDNGIESSIQRNVSFSGLSFITLAYGTLMGKELGFTHKIIAGIGEMGRKDVQIMINVEENGRLAGKFIEKYPDKIDSVLDRALKIYYECKKEVEEILNQDIDAYEVLDRWAKTYVNILVSLGITGSFMRYIGEDKNKLTKHIQERVGKERDDASRIYAQLEEIIREVVINIGKEKGFDGELIRHMTYDEIKDFLNTKIISEERIGELEKRKNNFLYLWHGADEIVITDKDQIKEIENELFKPEKDFLRGHTAHKGLVEGIVINAAEAKNIILVTSNTTPDLIHLVSHSSAIVTDEGGILCHAANIAREMKKPCVIGTKHATRLFKTGDRVIVDADNGIIKRLKNEDLEELK
ncbi:MAG: PEP-utilizing enzyme [Candidatus Woesearchaeota archaeon]